MEETDRGCENTTKDRRINVLGQTTNIFVYDRPIILKVGMYLDHKYVVKTLNCDGGNGRLENSWLSRAVPGPEREDLDRSC